MNKKQLKLIYIHKIGENVSGEGMYEFIFSNDPTNIDMKGWGWDISPACDNALPPEKEYIDLVVEFKTDKFKLNCLHDAVDREYMHGYHLIHALAYEEEFDEDDYPNIHSLDEDDNEYDDGWDLTGGSSMDDIPLLVFHYGISLQDVEDAFYSREIILNNNKFIESVKL